MRKSKTTNEPKPLSIVEHISDEEIGSLLNENYMRYTFFVMEDRALPDARDGLKPSQRRILMAMNDLHLSPSSAFEKVSKISGQTMGDYHPHGDAVITPTLVRLGQDWVMRYPLVAKQGNYGNIDGDPPAAARYIEGKLTKAGSAMLADLSPDVVPFIPNYNDKMKEPTVMPSLMPNLLVNGGAGIAVGVATRLAPHNLGEVVELIKAYIANPKITVDEAMQIMPGPDFPTGGVIRGNKGIRGYFEGGRGSIQIEGVYEIIDEGKGGQYIKITGVPYGVSPERLAEQIADLVKEKKIEGIADLKDLGYLDRKNKERVIDVRVWIQRGANAQLILNQLLKSTNLRTSFDVNQTVLIDGEVKENVPVLELVRVFVEHRQSVLRNKFTTEKAANEARVHILDGLLKVALKIDQAIALIRSSNDGDEAIQLLISNNIVDTQIQAEAVLKITLRQLTKLESSALETEQNKLVERNEYLTEVLSSEKKLLKIVAKEQDDLVKQIGDDRRTVIGHDSDDITAEDLIPEEQIVVTLTKDGYIKRVPVATFRVQNRGGKGVIGVKGRSEDEASDLFSGSTHDLFLFFTNKGLMYKKKGYQIPEAARTGKGTHLANLLALAAGERVTSTISLKSLDVDGYFLMATKHGLIKRTVIRDYNSTLKQRGLNAMKLNDGDEVAFVQVTDGSKDVCVVTANGMAVRYPEASVREVGRVSLGVRAMNLGDGDEIVSMITLDPTENPDILVITENGFGKRSTASQYRCLQGRYAKGVRTIDQVKRDRNGLIVTALTVYETDRILILTTKGKMIQIAVEDITSKGRVTMGNIIVKLDQNDTVQTVIKILPEDDSDDTTSEDA
jgi:DNA gyrase subunit A